MATPSSVTARTEQLTAFGRGRQSLKSRSGTVDIYSRFWQQAKTHRGSSR